MVKNLPIVKVFVEEESLAINLVGRVYILLYFSSVHGAEGVVRGV